MRERERGREATGMEGGGREGGSERVGARETERGRERQKRDTERV